MSAVLVDEAVKVPQELKAVKDALVALVAGFKQKKSLVEIVASEIPLVEAAFANLGELGDDMKDPQMAVAMGLMCGQIGAALLAPAAPPAA